MKRLVTALIILVVFSLSALYAQDEEVWWGSWYSPGNMLLSAEIGYEISPTTNYLVAYPEAEIILLKPNLGGVKPWDIGVAARPRIGIGFGDTSELGLGVSVLATAHVGFRGLGEFLTEYSGKVDVYAEAGLGFNLSGGDSLLAIAAKTGLRYFLTDTFTAHFAYSQWGDAGGVTLGGALKMGSSPSVKPREEIKATGEAVIGTSMRYTYLSYFQSIYWLSFYYGGIGIASDMFEPGEGTVWRISSSDDDSSYTIERSLISRSGDGSSMWKVRINMEEDEFLYEYKLNSKMMLTEILFRNPENGTVISLLDDETDQAFTHMNVEDMDRDELKTWLTETETIKVPAGSFSCEHYEFTPQGAEVSYEWWLNEDVPGGMVQFEWKDDETAITGQLEDVLSNVASELFK